MQKSKHEIFTWWRRGPFLSCLMTRKGDGGAIRIAEVSRLPWSGAIKWKPHPKGRIPSPASLWPTEDQPPKWGWRWRAAGTSGVSPQLTDAETLCRLRLAHDSHDDWMEHCSDHAWACVETMKPASK